MTEGIFFADAELPFHVWVRERMGDGYRWVLREARVPSDEAAGEPAFRGPEQGKAAA